MAAKSEIAPQSEQANFTPRKLGFLFRHTHEAVVPFHSDGLAPKAWLPLGGALGSITPLTPSERRARSDESRLAHPAAIGSDWELVACFGLRVPIGSDWR